MPLAARLYAALFLSGGAALVYQIVWVRRLSLVLGSTYEAIATVLAVFMAGLGVGSAAAAVLAARIPRGRLPALFAGLEVGTACFAVSFAWMLHALAPVFTWVAASSSLVGLARVGAASLVLLVPTALMGATLPVIAAHRDQLQRGGLSLGTLAGGLYAANTAGAVTGSLLAGVFLIEALGLRGTTWCAVAANALAAVLVLSTARGGASAAKKGEGEGAAASPFARPALGVAFLSGFGALASEVAWTRALVLVIGPTTYGFSFVVSAVILGLAAGSALGARAKLKLSAIQLGAAASCLSVIAILPKLVLPVGSLVRDYADAPVALLAIELLGVAALLFLPSFFLGATFPAVVARIGGTPARATGAALAWNTAGAVTGAIVAGFVLLPAVSVRACLLLAVLAHVAAAVLVLPKRKPLAWAAPAALGVGLVFVPKWDPEILAGGLYKYAPYLDPREFLDFLRRGELVLHEEDRAATVSVKTIGPRISLAVDGKVDATNKEDLLTQRLLAHVPLLLHRDPKEVLVIGLGSGVTAGSALTHPITRLSAVEISPGVVAAQELFHDVNHRAAEDERFRLYLDDGRNHLLVSRETYDVIISEPSNPWMAGVSGLFTRELFETAKQRLGPGGLFCQWAHLYNLPEQDLKTLVGTFTDVFTETALFALSESDIVLLGAADALPDVSIPTLASRLARASVAADLAEVGISSPAGFASLFLTSTPALASWAEDAPRHTDDRPVLEFRAPRSMHRDTSRSNLEALGALGPEVSGPFRAFSLATPTAADLRARAEGLLVSESFDWAFETFSRALELEPSSLEAHLGLVRSGMLAGRAEAMQQRLEALAKGPAPVEALIAFATLYRDRGQLDEAIRFLADALRREPLRREALLLAAEVAGERGELDAMANLARTRLNEDSLDAEAAALLAESTLRRGDFARAARQARGITAQRPDTARAQKVLAISLAEEGDVDGARAAFEALVALEPEVFVNLNNFAAFERVAGNDEAAARLYERAVDLSPLNVEGYEGLEATAKALGDDERLERARSMLALHRERERERN